MDQVKCPQCTSTNVSIEPTDGGTRIHCRVCMFAGYLGYPETHLTRNDVRSVLDRFWQAAFGRVPLGTRVTPEGMTEISGVNSRGEKEIVRFDGGNDSHDAIVSSVTAFARKLGIEIPPDNSTQL